jgi:integrase
VQINGLSTASVPQGFPDDSALIWSKARDATGLSGLCLHDLRHTGNTMAAATGASMRELMERMGHSRLVPL